MNGEIPSSKLASTVNLVGALRETIQTQPVSAICGKGGRPSPAKWRRRELLRGCSLVISGRGGVIRFAYLGRVLVRLTTRHNKRWGAV